MLETELQDMPSAFDMYQERSIYPLRKCDRYSPGHLQHFLPHVIGGRAFGRKAEFPGGKCGNDLVGKFHGDTVTDSNSDLVAAEGV